MNGITLKDHLTAQYLWDLLQEYSVLDTAQFFRLLKTYTPLKRRQRQAVIDRLSGMWGVTKDSNNDRKYLKKFAATVPSDSYKQTRCFWLLMEYFDKVESHFATGTYTQITMEIGSKFYDILYTARGEESYCLTHISKVNAEGFFVVVENESQIRSIVSDKIKAFVTINEQGQISYYSQEKGGGKE